MEIQMGKRSAQMDEAGLLERVRMHQETAIDLGTGDGRFRAVAGFFGELPAEAA